MPSNPAPRKPVVKFVPHPPPGRVTVDGHALDFDVLAQIFDPSSRVLWRFTMADGRIEATMFDERKVIWIEPEDR